MKSDLNVSSPPRNQTRAAAQDVAARHSQWRCGGKIYKNKGHVRGENFQTFLLSYYANGKRQLRRFVDFPKASEEAARIAEQKAQGALGAAALSADDRVSLQQALALLAENEGAANASAARLVELCATTRPLAARCRRA